MGILLGLSLLPGLLAASGAAEPDLSEWMSLDGNILELRLAHDEGGGRVDGGILKVDPTSRTLSWEGIEGAFGCTHGLTTSFDGVRSVRSGRGAGFVVKIQGQGELQLIPVVDADWFQRQLKVDMTPGGFAQAIKNGTVKITGKGQTDSAVGAAGPLAMGDFGFEGPRLRRVELPDDVLAHTKLALDGVLSALGRSPAPGLQLREALYGSPEELDLPELAMSPGSYEGASIRLRGAIGGEAKAGYELRAGDLTVRVEPTHEVEPAFRSAASAGMKGEVILVGVFRQRAAGAKAASSPQESRSAPADIAGALLFWDFERAPTEEPPPKDLVALDHLVADEKAYDGKVVRVVGKFRGGNLYQDLPKRTGSGSDFVIKVGYSSAWVTGKRPEGKGWSLDPMAPGDTENWVEVVGKARKKNGVVFLRASAISPTTPPSGHAAVAEVRRLAGGGRVPPEVVFALPLLSEPAPRNATFLIQFNKYMSEASLDGKVVLRYVGVDHVFSRMTTSFDTDRRALIVQPGELLTLGREIEVLLLQGIADTDGLSMAPIEEGVVYRARYRVGYAGS